MKGVACSMFVGGSPTKDRLNAESETLGFADSQGLPPRASESVEMIRRRDAAIDVGLLAGQVGGCCRFC